MSEQSEAKQRVIRRAELRRLAAEHANATISREWIAQYREQFVQADREARAIVEAWQ